MNSTLEEKLLREELEETVSAMSLWDKVETVYWLIDLIFVALWTLHKRWLSADQIVRSFDEVCNSNFSKIPFSKDENGKISKWPNFKRPDFSGIL